MVTVPGKPPLAVTKGLADIGALRPMGSGQFFRAGSLTKLFLANLILQLVDDGRLALEDRVSTFLPDLPGAGRITVRQLLNHTSGLSDYTRDEDFDRLYLTEPRREWGPQELIDIALKNGSTFAPGASWEYSNTNYIILGLVAEGVTGRPLAELLDIYIVDELGLEGTYLATGDDLPAIAARGYRLDRDGRWRDVTILDASSAWAAGGIVTTAPDMCAFIRAMAEGELISQAMLAESLSWQPVPEDQSFDGYGLGIAKRGELVGHTSSIAGFEAAAYYLPAADASLVAWVNGEGTGGTPDRILRAVAAELFAAP
jgi:D-alanyl-D-alanine carboxypeptidase